MAFLSQLHHSQQRVLGFCDDVVNRIKRVVVSYIVKLALSGRIRPDCRVQRVKYGALDTYVKITNMHGVYEAESMRFVAKHTSVPVPAVYDSWINDEGKHVIVMQRMEGQTFHRGWRKTTHAQKAHLLKQVQHYLNELRMLCQSGSGGIGPLLGGTCYDERLSDDWFGPFVDEKAFNDWRISTHDWQAAVHPPLGDRFRTLRNAMRDDHRIVFTHGDLGPHNILVDVCGPDPDDAKVVAFLDWEMSGWMPEHWEYMKCLHGQASRDEWCDLLHDVFPDYDAEWAIDRELLEISGRPC